jgi:hypothetical protein
VEKLLSIFNFNILSSKKIPSAAIFAVLLAIAFEVLNMAFDNRMYVFPYDDRYVKIKNHVSRTENTNFDVLVLGDCHILTGLDPRIIEKKTGLKSFNYATFARNTILSSYILLKNHLEHNQKKPLFIVMTFMFVADKYDNQSIVPFMFDIKDGNFLTLVHELGFSKAVASQISSLKNRDFFLEGRFPNELARPEKIRDFDNKVVLEGGYYSNSEGSIYNGYDPPRPPDDQYQPSQFFEKYLRKILALALKDHIVVLYPMFTIPENEYNNSHGNSPFLGTYSKLLSRLKQDFPNLITWEWQKDFSSPKLYRDPSHLNRQGCLLLSQKVAEFISAYYKKPRMGGVFH